MTTFTKSLWFNCALIVNYVCILALDVVAMVPSKVCEN